MSAGCPHCGSLEIGKSWGETRYACGMSSGYPPEVRFSECLRREAAALRRQVEERSGRSSIQDPADSDLDSILYDVGGDTGNEFQRRLIRYGIEWARDHFAPSESASREQCDRIAQMLADNPLNRMCDADSDPSPDVVTVPREELALLREIERYARIQLPGTTLALRDIDALRSGEAQAVKEAK